MPTMRATVLSGPNDLAVEEFPIPTSGDDDAVIRIEACGLCGSDVEQVRGSISGLPLPVVPGHEPLGVIESIGSAAAERWGVTEGDRICVQVVVPCRRCRRCQAGVFSSCTSPQGTYGYRPVEGETRVTGGFAEYMYLHPNSVVHRIDASVPPRVAAMYNSLAAGIRWARHIGEVREGDIVAVFGAGQRGIFAALAAKTAGASQVIITGLARDAHKLALAREFGADETLFADQVDVPERIRELTDGAMADVVLDLTPMAAQPVADALESVRTGGRVVLAGLKSDRPIELITDRIIKKAITVVGALGVDSRSIDEALAMLQAAEYPFAKMQTHAYSLEEVGRAIDVLAGDVEGEEAVHVAIVPR